MNLKKLLIIAIVLGSCVTVGLNIPHAQTQIPSQVQTGSQMLMTFNSMPKGAAVFMDGQPLGIAPISDISVPIGMHHFKFTLNGFPDWEGDYLIFGQEDGLGADLTGKFISRSRKSQFEDNPKLINILSNNIFEDWWSTTANKIQFAVTQNQPDGTAKNFVYKYDVSLRTTQYDAHAFTTLTDPLLRSSLSLPVYNSDNNNDIFTSAYVSPSAKYILHIQKNNANTPVFALTDTSTKKAYLSTYNFTSENNYSLFDTSYDPTWSTDEQLVWLDQYLNNTDPTVLWLQNGQAQTFHFNGMKNGTSFMDGGMYTRPSNQGYALVWGRPYDKDGNILPRTPYLLDLPTGMATPLPIPTGDIPNFTGMLFSPDGKWIYMGTLEGIKRMNVENLNDIEMVDPFPSATAGYQVIDMSYTLDYAFVSGPGNNALNFLYKIANAPDRLVTTPSPTVTPLATSASVPGSNQIGG